MRAPETRAEARRLIITEASTWRARHLLFEIRRGTYRAALPPFSRRTLQQAVALVRHRRLVSPETLVLAGFNAEGRHG